MIMGRHFVDIAHAGALPHRRTLLVEEAGKLSWLSTSMEPWASPGGAAERDVWAQAVRSVSSRPFTADIEDLALRELGLSTSQVDVLGSAALRKCPMVWSKVDNGWKRGWSGDLWDLLYIHVARGSLKRVVAKIARDRAQAVLIIPSLKIKEAKDAPWVQDLRCMILIATQLPAAQDIFVDAQGNPLPPPAKGPSTTVPYVDWSLAYPDRDMQMFSITARVQREGFTIVDRPDRSISRIMALPVRYRQETADRWYCPPAIAQDAPLPDELDMVCGYMSSPMHLGVPSKGPPAKSWWEDPALLRTLHEERVHGVCVGALGGPKRTRAGAVHDQDPEGVH